MTPVILSWPNKIGTVIAETIEDEGGVDEDATIINAIIMEINAVTVIISEITTKILVILNEEDVTIINGTTMGVKINGIITNEIIINHVIQTTPISEMTTISVTIQIINAVISVVAMYQATNGITINVITMGIMEETIAPVNQLLVVIVVIRTNNGPKTLTLTTIPMLAPLMTKDTILSMQGIMLINLHHKLHKHTSLSHFKPLINHQRFMLKVFLPKLMPMPLHPRQITLLDMTHKITDIKTTTIHHKLELLNMFLLQDHPLIHGRTPSIVLL